MDFPGFGKCGELREPYSVGDYADWLYGVMQELDLRKPHVIAHSFGCRVAVKLASRDNDLFDKILLTGPAGVILKRGFTYRARVWAYRRVKRIFPRWAEKKFGSAEYRGLSPVMKESYKKIVNEDLRDCARLVKNRVLIVEGRADTTTPMAEAKAYLACFARGKLCEIEGGHFAFAEHPLAFNLIAEEFLYGR